MERSEIRTDFGKGESTTLQTILKKCDFCNGSGILIDDIPSYLKPVKVQKVCFNCEGKGFKMSGNEII